MTTRGYVHEVLSGFLSSNGVIALILLKFKFFIPSSAITYTWVSLRPQVGRLDLFHVDWPLDEDFVDWL